MKFTFVSALVLGLAALVTAEYEPRYFFAPAENAEFTVNDEITFTMNGITNDADETIIAKLFNAEDDTEIMQIGSYTGDGIVRPDDMDAWSFDWVIHDVGPGTYYVRLYEQDADGQIDDDDEEDREIISYDFQIKNPSKRKRSAHLKRSLLTKKNRASL